MKKERRGDDKREEWKRQRRVNKMTKERIGNDKRKESI